MNTKRAEAAMIIPMGIMAISGAIMGLWLGWGLFHKVVYKDKIIREVEYKLNDDTIQAWCSVSGNVILNREELEEIKNKEYSKGYRVGFEKAYGKPGMEF